MKIMAAVTASMLVIMFACVIITGYRVNKIQENVNLIKKQVVEKNSAGAVQVELISNEDVDLDVREEASEPNVEDSLPLPEDQNYTEKTFGIVAIRVQNNLEEAFDTETLKLVTENGLVLEEGVRYTLNDEDYNTYYPAGEPYLIAPGGEKEIRLIYDKDSGAINGVYSTQTRESYDF